MIDFKFGGNTTEFNVPNINMTDQYGREYPIYAWIRTNMDTEGNGALMGSIMLWPGAQLPAEYWNYCNGQTVGVIDNQQLYSLLNWQYGGNGKDEFNLPNTADKDGVKYIICCGGDYYPTRSTDNN